MTERDNRDLHGLDAARLTEFDQVGDRFESAWRSGDHPQIEDFLDQVPEDRRGDLLKYLMAIELEYRSKSGEQPDPHEYTHRFPAYSEFVRQALAQCGISTDHRAGESTLTIARSEQHDTHSRETVAASSRDGAKLLPERIGRYRIIQVLGRGSFGIVYRGRDDDLERDVAIKVWRSEQRDVDESLLQEAKTVARMEKHPNIVGVYDVGRATSGDCFVVFEFIQGQTLSQAIKAKRTMTADDILLLMLQINSAIAHAHAAGLVHRDLKPANILLDADGNAHVADFGLAVNEQTQRNRAGEISGTPAYMSPEQVRGETHRMDGRSDLWAIGIILYELLTGRRPFDGETLPQLFDEIQHRDPQPPRQIKPQASTSLEQVCLKCLAKTPAERYTSAADLQIALQRIQLEPVTRRRRRLAVGGGMGACLGIVMLIVMALLFKLVPESPPQVTVSPPQSLAPAPRITIAPGSGLMIRQRATLRGHTSEVWSTAFTPDNRLLASAGVDRVIKLWDVATAKELRQLTGHESEVRDVAFSPSGELLASAGADRTIILWDMGEFLPQHTLAGHDGDVRGVTFAPDGKRLFSGSVDETLRSWNPQAGIVEETLVDCDAGILSIVLSPDGTTIAVACDDGILRLYDVQGNRPWYSCTGHRDGVCAVVFSPDGSQIASASWDGTARIWNASNGNPIRVIEGHDGAVRDVAFSRGGTHLATCGDDMTIRLWELASGSEIGTIRGHTGPLTSIQFSFRGAVLASASEDKTVQLWEIDLGEEIEPPVPSTPEPEEQDPVFVVKSADVPVETVTLKFTEPKDPGFLPGLVANPRALPGIGRWQIESRFSLHWADCVA